MHGQLPFLLALIRDTSLGSGSIYWNQQLTAANPVNPKILGLKVTRTQPLVAMGIGVTAVTAYLVVKDQIWLYCELIPVWKVGRRERTNRTGFYLGWNEELGGKGDVPAA